MTPLVVGHRGAPAEAPENTVESMRRAAELGADWVELDVRRAPDGTLLCCHDPLPPATAGLATIADVLASIADAGIGADVELKEPGYEAEVVALATEILPRERLLFTSFHDVSVAAVKAADPAVRTGLLVWHRREAAPWRRLARVQADVLVAPRRFAPLRIAERARARGIPLWVYTVNEPDELARWVAAGVEAIVTDHPDRLVAAARALASSR